MLKLIPFMLLLPLLFVCLIISVLWEKILKFGAQILAPSLTLILWRTIFSLGVYICFLVLFISRLFPKTAFYVYETKLIQYIFRSLCQPYVLCFHIYIYNGSILKQCFIGT